MVASIIGSVLLAILSYLSQIAVFPALGAFAIAPNTILALTIVFAMIYGPWSALAMGFFGGIMVDFMAGGAIGISSLIPIIVGFLLGVFKREINSGHFLWAMIFASIAHLLNDFWIITTLYFGRIEIFTGFGTLFRSILSAIETGIFAGLFFIIISRLMLIGEKKSGLPYLQRY